MEMSRKIRPMLLAIALIIVMPSCIIDRIPSDAADLQPGDRVPEFAITLSDGSTLTDEMLAGKPSVIAFFHTGCGDCREELPVLQHFYRDYGKDVNVICISRAEDEASVSSYWELHSLTLPYSAQDDASLYYRFAKNVIPRVYVVDSGLVIRKIFTDDPVASYGELVEAVSMEE
ncbi:MAG: TlpA family protein disulfide reductase [Clostridium sp.]|nr:TlpA family protein disulfide reductase [Bacteroides sp.]MCM1197969.1 TlpA family protein disulfide reductase [Clostridium sp.]